MNTIHALRLIASLLLVLFAVAHVLLFLTMSLVLPVGNAERRDAASVLIDIVNEVREGYAR